MKEQEKQLKNTTDTLICIAGTRFYHDHRPLNDGETVDLRGFVDGEGTLHWDVPSGNWCIQEFLCCHDPLPHADYLSADASGTVLEAAMAGV